MTVTRLPLSHTHTQHTRVCSYVRARGWASLQSFTSCVTSGKSHTPCTALVRNRGTRQGLPPALSDCVN